jgi:hypothetical protein
MTFIKHVLNGVFGAAGAVLSGAAKGVEQSFNILSAIPEHIKLDKQKSLSGKYVIDLSEGKTVTVHFDAVRFGWAYLEYCGKPQSDDEWKKLLGEGYGPIDSQINSWANKLLKHHGLKI